MADYPPDFSRTANDAVSRLHDYQAQNPLRVTTGPRGYSTSPSPGLASPSMSPTTSVRQLSPPSPRVPSFQPSRMAIPPTAYAPSHTSAQHAPPKAPPPIIGTQSKSPSPPYAPPTGHIPIIGTQSKSPSPPYAPPLGHMPVIGTQSKSPSPEPSPGPYVPQIYREPLDRLTREMLYDRIYLVLRDILAIWWAENPDAMHRLVCKFSFPLHHMVCPPLTQDISRLSVRLCHQPWCTRYLWSQWYTVTLATLHVHRT